ncbi:MAG: endonuclease III [Elusimicrobiota bacterium]|jgi:endonuclease-3|nr:endonuclease III [Elusimicrobiota bacterium]
MLLKKEFLPRLIKDLKSLYPQNKTALRYSGPFQLLAAVILSAQCTDARVNMVTPVLFQKYPTPDKMAAADIKDIENIIRSTGFYRSKAKSISESSKALIKNFGGQVPGNMRDLLTLRGVARKTANVVLADYFGVAQGVVVDTHVKRLAYRMGLTKNAEPVKTERDLMRLFDKKYWIFLGNALVWHGRKLCPARAPKCAQCKLNSYCPKNGVKK